MSDMSDYTLPVLLILLFTAATIMFVCLLYYIYKSNALYNHAILQLFKRRATKPEPEVKPDSSSVDMADLAPNNDDIVFQKRQQGVLHNLKQSLLPM